MLSRQVVRLAAQVHHLPSDREEEGEPGKGRHQARAASAGRRSDDDPAEGRSFHRAMQLGVELVVVVMVVVLVLHWFWCRCRCWSGALSVAPVPLVVALLAAWRW